MSSEWPKLFSEVPIECGLLPRLTHPKAYSGLHEGWPCGPLYAPYVGVRPMVMQTALKDEAGSYEPDCEDEKRDRGQHEAL